MAILPVPARDPARPGAENNLPYTPQTNRPAGGPDHPTPAPHPCAPRRAAPRRRWQPLSACASPPGPVPRGTRGTRREGTGAPRSGGPVGDTVRPGNCDQAARAGGGPASLGPAGRAGRAAASATTTRRRNGLAARLHGGVAAGPRLYRNVTSRLALPGLASANSPKPRAAGAAVARRARRGRTGRPAAHDGAVSRRFPGLPPRWAGRAQGGG
jgi:hypothetical protein